MGAYDLTTKAEVKLFLRITDTSEDALIDKLIARATDRIEWEVDRKLKSRSYIEDMDGSGRSDLMLLQYPIIAVTEVNIDPQLNFAAGTQIPLGDIAISHEEGRISFIGMTNQGALFPRVVKGIRVKYSAGFATIPPALEDACIELVSIDFARSREGGAGVASETTGGHAITWIDGLPESVKTKLLPFRRAA